MTSAQAPDPAADLRAWTARQLRRDDIPEDVWRFLVEWDHVREVVEFGDERRWFLKRAKHVLTLMAVARRQAPSERAGRPPPPSPHTLAPHEVAREGVVSRYMGHFARRLPRVRRFRAQHDLPLSGLP